MTIVHGDSELSDLLDQYSDAFREQQEYLTPQEHIQDIRVNAHQVRFCELFSKYAPQAWSELVGLRRYSNYWLHCEMERALGRESREAKLAAPAHWYLRQLVKSWAQEYAIETGWVEFVAERTIEGIAYAETGQYDAPETLLIHEYPILNFTGDGHVELGLTKGQITPESFVIVYPDQGPVLWKTMEESKGSFRERAISAYTEELDAQLSRLESPVATARDLEAAAHHVGIVIQRYAGKRNIRSLAKEWRMSRPGIHKAINSTITYLGLPELPGNWGVTIPKSQ